MILQPLIIHNQDSNERYRELFVHIENGIAACSGIQLSAGGMLSLDTYFNSFSIEKWKRYTLIDNLALTFFTDEHADLEISCMHAAYTKHGIIMTNILCEREEREWNDGISTFSYEGKSKIDFRKEISVCRKHTVRFSHLPEDGILFAVCRARKEGLVLGGYYETDVHKERLQHIRIAAGICTFHREDKLKRILSDLRPILVGKSCVIPKEKLYIFVADNGHTLQPQVGQDGVEILTNPNLGGSGGFARVMLDALHAGHIEKPFTHILLMDDDIELPRHAVEVMYALLCLMKPEYRENMIGSAMLQLAEPFLRFESGAFFDPHRCRADVYDRGLDVRSLESVLYGERGKRVNYIGWWLACIPVSTIRRIGMPMPFFIHFDDIEYGIREAGKEKILLNTISIYHPAIINKAPSWDRYYVRRNMMITSATAGEKWYFVPMLAEIWKVVLRDLLHYRYEETEFELMAVGDFCKGYRHLCSADIEAAHKELCLKAKPMMPMDVDMKDQYREFSYRHMRRTDYLRQCADLLLPLKREAVRVNKSCEWLPFRSARLYEQDLSGNYKLLMRSRRHMAWCVFRLAGYSLVMILKKGKIEKNWKRGKRYFISEKYWKKVLLKPSF